MRGLSETWPFGVTWTRYLLTELHRTGTWTRNVPGHEESCGKCARSREAADALLPGLGVVHVAFGLSVLQQRTKRGGDRLSELAGKLGDLQLKRERESIREMRQCTTWYCTLLPFVINLCIPSFSFSYSRIHILICIWGPRVFGPFCFQFYL